ncbi:GNAT family N-acetyltransferase [Lactococcus formosensis subsp. bovis]|uniref:GNAT family N-acetyltransferase n=1 Tax=Lactococcus formosensis TaxID=1281486 RepID=UPI001BCF87EE|nr:GNAT family N-acetyltransferase [Lactococcus formosensis]
MTSIRSANQADLEEVAHINVNNWQVTYENILPQSYLESLEYRAFQRKWERFIVQPSQELLVKELENKVAGFIAFSESKDWSDNLYIDSLHISQKFQRKGVGTQLLLQVLQQAKEDKKTVTIAILKNNENARKLYTKLGAVHLKDFSDKFGDVTTDSELLIWK